MEGDISMFFPEDVVIRMSVRSSARRMRSDAERRG